MYFPDLEWFSSNFDSILSFRIVRLQAAALHGVFDKKVISTIRFEISLFWIWIYILANVQCRWELPLRCIKHGWMNSSVNPSIKIIVIYYLDSNLFLDLFVWGCVYVYVVWLKGCTLYVYSTKLNIFTFLSFSTLFWQRRGRTKAKRKICLPQNRRPSFQLTLRL